MPENTESEYNIQNIMATNILDVEHKIGNIYKTQNGHLDYFHLIQLDDDGRFALISLESGEHYTAPSVCASNRHPSDHEEEPDTIINISNDELKEYMDDSTHFLEFVQEHFDFDKSLNQLSEEEDMGYDKLDSVRELVKAKSDVNSNIDSHDAIDEVISENWDLIMEVLSPRSTTGNASEVETAG